jgi:hypothetical protein
VLRGCAGTKVVWSQSRTPLPWTVQGIGVGVLLKTLVIVALAEGGTAMKAAIKPRRIAQ